MKKEKVDDSIIYSEVLNYGGHWWDVLVREGGSVSIYAKTTGSHAVVVDDCAPVVWANGTADDLEKRFILMQEAAEHALRAIAQVKAAIAAAESEANQCPQ